MRVQIKVALFGFLGGCLLSAAVATPVQASDVFGVYAVLRRVKFEPDEKNPTRVRLCGAFALANVGSGSYDQAKPGYMYYSCPVGQEAACMTQWKELNSAALRGQCIGFGQRRDNMGQPYNNGTLRETLPAAGTDLYPVGMGAMVDPPSTDAKTFCAQAGALTVPITACLEPMDIPDMGGTPPPPPPGKSGCSFGSAGVGSARVGILGALGVTLLALRRRRRS